ncbi:MAG: 4Fe-4S binding protein [Asgard group archaeon]|nr:4Fe-4S binding protein [Asgard group archaeon]
MSSSPLIEIRDSCIGCNKCVDVCPRYLFSIENKKAVITDFDPCHDCGHCIAVCPVDAIIHQRLNVSTIDEDFPLIGKQVSYDEILESIRQRRSIRLFSTRKITKEEINQLIQLGRYAPTGHNSRKVCYTIIDGREQIEYLLDNVIELFRKMKSRLSSPFWMILITLLGKRESYMRAKENLYRLNSHIYHWEKGIDKVFHNSSTLILLHAAKDVPSPIEDCNIAAQNIALGTQTLGLGSTFIGYLHKSWYYSKKIRNIVDLPDDHLLHACLAVGKPKNKFRRLVSRPEPSVVFKNIN